MDTTSPIRRLSPRCRSKALLSTSLSQSGSQAWRISETQKCYKCKDIRPTNPEITASKTHLSGSRSPSHDHDVRFLLVLSGGMAHTFLHAHGDPILEGGLYESFNRRESINMGPLRRSWGSGLPDPGLRPKPV